MYSRILVPLDGSKLAEKALRHAEGLSKSDGATIHLIRVVGRYPREVPAGNAGPAQSKSAEAILELSRKLERAQLEHAGEYLERAAGRLKKDGMQVEVELLQGNPHEQIVDYARKHGVDLIIMSGHGLGGPKRSSLGSVTERVARSGEVPVMVVSG